ncbi:MAG: 2-phospho-L-lactate transferase CofD family protein, partial [Pseudomonadota bacterium]
PDIDTMLYTLSDRIDRDQGWGVADEGRRALDVLNELGEDTWMFLGDRDFGLHIYRTARLKRGDRPSDITADIAKQFGIAVRLLLPTDDRVQTRVRTDTGWLSFQAYFVRERCTPEVLELRYDGIENARPTPEALSAIESADLIVIAPSNPLVSIAPILCVKGVRAAVQAAPAPVVAVSPLIAGKVIKGPADRMLASLGHRADALGIAEFYRGTVDQLVLDHRDHQLAPDIEALGITPIVSDILMPDRSEKARLARDVVRCLARREAAGQTV